MFFARINFSSFPKTWNFLLAKISCEKKFLMILHFVEFLAHIEIVKSDFLQTSQFLQKRWRLLRKKKLTDIIVLIKEKTLNTLSSFYQYLDRLFKIDWFPLYPWCATSLDLLQFKSPSLQESLPPFPLANHQQQTTSDHIPLAVSPSTINWWDDMLGWQFFFSQYA